MTAAGVSSLPRGVTAGVTIALIRDSVAAATGLTVPEMLADRRNRPTVEARSIAMFLSHRRTLASLPMIGRCLGGKDHSTVLSAVRRITHRVAAERDFARRVGEIELGVLAEAARFLEAADQIDPQRLAATVLRDANALGHLTISEGVVLSAALLVARDQTARATAETRRLAAVTRALGRFLAATEAIRDARGEEDRYLARQSQHEAFAAMRTAFNKETKR